DAFRAFTIPERMQEEFGYPPLTDRAKDKILSTNAAALYGVDLDAVRRPETAMSDWLTAAQQELRARLAGGGAGGGALGGLEGVVAQDAPTGVVVELLELVRVVEWLRHALDVGPVAAEDHAVGAHEVDDLVRVVLPE